MAVKSSSGIRAIRAQLSSSRASFSLQSPVRRFASDYSHLQSELPARRLPLLYEDFTPDQSRKLSISLAPFIQTSIPDTKPSPTSTNLRLPPAHHLVYNNPIILSNKLLADGTDPLQSPGRPFVRRMWAGGSVTAGPKVDTLTMDGGKFVTLEGIRDVTIKGKPGQEKVFVGIERRMAKLDDVSESEDSVRSRLWTNSSDDFGDAALIERRNIVFMYERTPEELAAIKEGKPGPPPKTLKRKSRLYSSTMLIVEQHQMPPTSLILSRRMLLSCSVTAPLLSTPTPSISIHTTAALLRDTGTYSSTAPSHLLSSYPY